eukprot:scaffold130031_cov18-Tisochrysis_lutea.AAC.1
MPIVQVLTVGAWKIWKVHILRATHGPKYPGPEHAGFKHKFVFAFAWGTAGSFNTLPAAYLAMGGSFWSKTSQADPKRFSMDTFWWDGFPYA